MQRNVSSVLKGCILGFHKDEMTGSVLYAYMASRQNTQLNRETLLRIPQTEKSHYEIWKS